MAISDFLDAFYCNFTAEASTAWAIASPHKNLSFALMHASKKPPSRQLLLATSQINFIVLFSP